MTGWLFHDAWSPALVLLAGVVTAAALSGVGLLALEVVGIDLPAPWRLPAGLLLGVEILALDVELLGWTHASTRPVLIAGWCLYVVVGLLYLWSARPRERLSPPRPHPFLVIAAVATLSTLLVALAPSTKIDEIYYHMLLPSRVVGDGALRFYRYPWEGAAWPQMLFQLSSAPLHALGVPDAPNVVSWCMNVVLLLFAWRHVSGDSSARLVRGTQSAVPSAVRSSQSGGEAAVRREVRDRPPQWPSLCLAAIVVGLYPSVWWPTAGAHAMGDLATTCAVVALCAPDLLRDRVPPRAYAFAVALFSLAAAATKLSLLPLSLAMTVAVIAQLWRDAAAAERRRIVAAAIGPWIVFYLPVVLATWLHSGAPFGPFEAWRFPGTVYDAAHIHRVVDIVRQRSQRLVHSTPLELLARRTPLLWLAALAALVTRTLPPRSRLLAAAILLAQLAIVVVLLPWDPRFLSGIPIALAILYARRPSPRVAAWLARPARTWTLAALLVLPWLGAQLWYSLPFVRVSTGLLPVESFRARYIPVWRDLAPLDSLLPRDAVLLVDGYRLGAVYSPRPIVWSAADLRGRPPLYQLGPTCTVTNPSFTGGSVVLRDDSAVVEAPRNPLRGVVRGPVCVRRLEW